MTRFYGSLDGAGNTPATKTGHASTGVIGHVRGWNTGVRVTAMPASAADRDDSPERDAFVVDITGGSHGNAPQRYGVLTIAETGTPGVLRVVVSVGDGGNNAVGTVGYLQPDGRLTSREVPEPVEAS